MTAAANNDYLDLPRALSDETVVLAFSGLMDQGVLVSLTDSLDARLSRMGVADDRTHGIREVLVEQVQNVLHHREPTAKQGRDDAVSGMCLVRRTGRQVFEVSTGNVVTAERFGELQRAVEELNGMTPEQLTGRFQSIGKQGRLRPDGSSRLGLLQMARKSRAPLRIVGRPIPDDATRSYFILTVQV
jgi:hypothetical protein